MVIGYLIEKEFKQMWRSVILPVVFVLLPIVMMNMVPRIATQEIKNLKFSVVDHDKSQESARLIRRIDASEFFALNNCEETFARAEESLMRGESDLVIEIEHGFERDLVTRGTAGVMVSANAVTGVKAGLGSSYVSQIIAGREAQVRFLFNKSLDYKVFMIPALIGMQLVLLIGFLPALNIVGEKASGTIEQINVTPVGKFEFILAKLVPYWCVGIAILLFSILLASAIHGVAPVGSVWAILFFSLLFIIIVSGFGIIVSNYSETTQQAALVMYFFLIIFILLSGLLTPVSSMPEWARTLTLVNPMRFYIEPMRMVYIKGSSVGELLPYVGILSLMAVATSAWAVWSYRKSS